MSKIEGGCLCGAVRYETEADPVHTAICHCRNCQKQSGSALSIIVGFPAGSLTTRGESLTAYKDTGVSGKPVLRYFCNLCGSPLITRAEFSSDVEFIKAGTLDDPSWLKPEAAYWGDREQAWLKVPAQWPTFAQNPED